MTTNGTTPQIDIDPSTGRQIAASYATAGGTCIWFADGQLPAVRHVVTPQAFGGQIKLDLK